MLKAVLIDFDGTLVTTDVLDVLCEIVGKEKKSAKLNKEFHAGRRDGVSTLVERINYLRGVSLAQITEKLDQDSFLMPGSKELLAYLNDRNVFSILNSGNILPVLLHYQALLGISEVVGTSPKISKDVIVGISEENFPARNFKAEGIKKILAERKIDVRDTVAIGDSPADKQVFEMAGKSIAINPKYGIQRFADFCIKNDLREAIEIIQSLNNNSYRGA